MLLASQALTKCSGSIADKKFTRVGVKGKRLKGRGKKRKARTVNFRTHVNTRENRLGAYSIQIFKLLNFLPQKRFLQLSMYFNLRMNSMEISSLSSPGLFFRKR
jgi:hypothetical protein